MALALLLGHRPIVTLKAIEISVTIGSTWEEEDAAECLIAVLGRACVCLPPLCWPRGDFACVCVSVCGDIRARAAVTLDTSGDCPP